MNSIKERRLALGMTQPQLSAKLRAFDPRIDTGMVSRFEQEVCFPTEAVMKGLEMALQADRSELYSELELSIIPSENSKISPITARIAEIVPFGRTKAISREELANRLNLSDRQMRQAVSLARREGLVIINDQGGSGYYRSDDVADMRRQLAQTHHRALSLLAQEKHLKARINAVEGECI